MVAISNDHLGPEQLILDPLWCLAIFRCRCFFFFFCLSEFDENAISSAIWHSFFLFVCSCASLAWHSFAWSTHLCRCTLWARQSFYCYQGGKNRWSSKLPCYQVSISYMNLCSSHYFIGYIIQCFYKLVWRNSNCFWGAFSSFFIGMHTIPFGLVSFRFW